MARVLKETTTLNVLAKNFEERKNTLKKEKADIEKRIKKVKKREKKKIKKTKRKYNLIFTKKYGWIFIIATILLSIFFFKGNSFAINCLIAFAIALLMFIFVSARKLYSKKRVYREIGADLHKFSEEKRELYEKAKVIRNKCRELNDEIYERRMELKGNEGEQDVISYIKKHFGSNTYLLNDITLKHGEKTAQIDHIIVSPKGIFCLETKNYSLPYQRAGNRSWQYFEEHYTHYINSPQYQSIYHVDVLSLLLPKEKENIIPLVILTNPEGSFEGNDEDCRVLKLEELEEYMENCRVRYEKGKAKKVAEKILKLNQN